MKGSTRIMTGLGFGSFIYLFIALFNQTPPTLTREVIGSVFLISACAGAASIFFDLERLSFFAALLLHFAVINLAVGACSLFNKGLENVTWMSYLSGMLLFYVCSWLLFILRNRIIARELNRWIQRNLDGSPT